MVCSVEAVGEETERYVELCEAMDMGTVSYWDVKEWLVEIDKIIIKEATASMKQAIKKENDNVKEKQKDKEQQQQEIRAHYDKTHTAKHNFSPLLSSSSSSFSHSSLLPSLLHLLLLPFLLLFLLSLLLSSLLCLLLQLQHSQSPLSLVFRI
jgi:hypothetical protein